MASAMSSSQKPTVYVADDDAGVLFGRLDNEPLLADALRVGDEHAVSFERVVEHRKAWEFQKQEGTVAFDHPSAGLGVKRVDFQPDDHGRGLGFESPRSAQ